MREPRPCGRKRSLGASVAAVALVAAACGGGGLSLTEYAAEVEVLVSDMNREVDAANAVIEAGGPVTSEDLSRAFERRGRARAVFVDALAALDPPDQAKDLHESALVIVSDLRDAAFALAARAAATADEDLATVGESPEAKALEAIDEQAIAICELAQASFDDTAEREDFRGSSWIPRELKEVVDVAFRCTAEERSAGSG